jgi:hypothetical protein
LQKPTLFWLLGFSLLVLSMWQGPVYAHTPPALNVGAAPLQSQSIQARQQATKIALQQVMIKLSGSSNVLAHTGLNSLLNDAQRYVDASRFIDTPFTGLEVEFNQVQLENWLKQQQLPLWGAQRPTATLWMVTRNPVSQQLAFVEPDAHQSMFDAVTTAADARGIQIISPLYDLTDVKQVGLIDAWGQFVDTLHRASERYETDYTLSGRLYVNADLMWQFDGFIKSDTTLRTYSYSGLDTEVLIQYFIDDYAELLASTFAIDTGLFSRDNPISNTIAVAGISGLKELFQLDGFLRSLSIVDSFAHIGQQGNVAIFELSLLAEVDKLLKIISASKRFELMESVPVIDVIQPEAAEQVHSSLATNAFAPVIHLRWIP